MSGHIIAKKEAEGYRKKLVIDPHLSREWIDKKITLSTN